MLKINDILFKYYLKKKKKSELFDFDLKLRYNCFFYVFFLFCFVMK